MLRRIFEFNRAEKNGMLFLIILIGIVLGINFSLPHLTNNQTDAYDHEKAYQEFIAILQEQDSHDSQSSSNTSKKDATNKPVNYFQFNPNTATAGELKRLGFNRYQVRNLQKYLQAGGRIHEKSDLLKIYGIDTAFYHNIASYITIPREKQRQEKQNIHDQSSRRNDKDPFKTSPLDINRSDTSILQKIPGIGPRRSETIIKYRDLLGGYYSRDQFNEVYGLPDSVINKLEKVSVMDTTVIRRISLNNASFKDLVRHPYLSEYQTKSILKYRDMQQEIASAQELYEHQVIDSATWYRVRYYLKP